MTQTCEIMKKNNLMTKRLNQFKEPMRKECWQLPGQSEPIEISTFHKKIDDFYTTKRCGATAGEDEANNYA